MQLMGENCFKQPAITSCHCVSSENLNRDRLGCLRVLLCGVFNVECIGLSLSSMLVGYFGHTPSKPTGNEVMNPFPYCELDLFERLSDREFASR
jgi:hypothetical protein